MIKLEILLSYTDYDLNNPSITAMFIKIIIQSNYDIHMYTFVLTIKPTSCSSNLTISLLYIISLPRTELLKCSFTFIVHVIAHYEYGACENGCMSEWRSGNAAKGVCVKVNGEMIEYILNRCNNGYQMHAHVTMYASLANFLNIECLFRVEKYVILKPFLTITFLSFMLSTSI